jgi:hypothetical protein
LSSSPEGTGHCLIGAVLVGCDVCSPLCNKAGVVKEMTGLATAFIGEVGLFEEDAGSTALELLRQRILTASMIPARFFSRLCIVVVGVHQISLPLSSLYPCSASVLASCFPSPLLFPNRSASCPATPKMLLALSTRAPSSAPSLVVGRIVT